MHIICKSTIYTHSRTSLRKLLKTMCNDYFDHIQISVELWWNRCCWWAVIAGYRRASTTAELCHVLCNQKRHQVSTCWCRFTGGLRLQQPGHGRQDPTCLHRAVIAQYLGTVEYLPAVYKWIVENYLLAMLVVPVDCWMFIGCVIYQWIRWLLSIWCQQECATGVALVLLNGQKLVHTRVDPLRRTW